MSHSNVYLPYYESLMPEEVVSRLNLFFCSEIPLKAIELFNILTMTYGVLPNSSYFQHPIHPDMELYFEDSTFYKNKVAALVNLNEFTNFVPKWERITLELQNPIHRFNRKYVTQGFRYYGVVEKEPDQSFLQHHYCLGDPCAEPRTSART